MKMTFKDIVKEQIPPQVIITIIFVVMLAIGYGIWSEETNGTISLTAPIFGTDFIVDGKVAGVSRNAGEKMSYKFSSGKHTVIVTRGDFWPWTQEINLQAKETKTLHPFLVNKEIKPIAITSSSYSNGTISVNTEYSDALALFINLSVKEEFSGLIASTEIKNIRSADYFPGRTDVLLIATNDGIFAVETGSSTPRNFQPVYKGKEPVFVKTGNDTLIIKDGDSLFRLVGFGR